MDDQLSPRISSFVLRFVQDEPDKPMAQPAYRGSIQHVQTNQELSFTHWEDAILFMAQFIPLEVFKHTEQPTSAPNAGEETEKS